MSKVLVISVCAWAISQVSKMLVVLVRKRRLDFRYFVGGGMPSSHSATVCALATSVAIAEGLGSVAFAISVILALVVMYDAAGVRRWVGKQSIILNRLMEEIRAGHPVAAWERELREFIGHTPLQVAVGATLGIVVAWLAFILFP